MANKSTKSWSFYSLFFCFLFTIYGCGEKEEVIRVDINPKIFNVESDSCTLIATANISEFEYTISSIIINGEYQELDGDIVKKVGNETYISDWFKIQITEDHKQIKIQLKKNTSTETRTLGITIAFYSQYNHLSIYQKGKS